MGDGGVTILEMDARAADRSDEILDEVVRIERRIFPKHESLARNFQDELRRRNSGLLYAWAAAPPEGKTGAAAAGSGRVKRRVEVGEVVGYIMFSWISSLCASITKLAVKERHRRHGHGEALLLAAVAKCRSRRVARVQLHVDPARDAAIALYRKLGFRVDALVQGYYSPERDAYRMFLDFDEDGQ